MATVFLWVSNIVNFYLAILWCRLVLEWVRVLIPRDFRTPKILVILFELVYIVTDPPVNFVRRRIKPVRLGPVLLDLSLMIVIVALWLLMYALTFTYWLSRAVS
ncbi:YggT family protein [Canibacter sp. lx-45]|uniref:YggT family protein n=1 Tax=Canibacter zhuwentaonis TaxID=2837491 RepID=UPI001BDC06D6|nr:YggT family protein [Canibacter zhuwentaonis]